jgi:hypothetical protein
MEYARMAQLRAYASAPASISISDISLAIAVVPTQQNRWPLIIAGYGFCEIPKRLHDEGRRCRWVRHPKDQDPLSPPGQKPSV